MGRKAPKKYEKMDYHEKEQFRTDMMGKYGLDRIKTQQNEITGRGGWDSEAEGEAIARAMANDYDTRRTIELAQETGNKKAAKLGQGIDDISQAADAERFMSKTHYNRMDSGGNYDGASDEHGVMNFWKDKAFKQREANAAPIEDNTADMLNSVTREKGPVTFSKEYAQSRAGEDAYKDFTAGGGYSALMSGEQGAAESFRQQRADNVKEYMKPDPVSQAGEGLNKQGDFRMDRQFTKQRKAGQVFGNQMG